MKSTLVVLTAIGCILAGCTTSYQTCTRDKFDATGKLVGRDTVQSRVSCRLQSNQSIDKVRASAAEKSMNVGLTGIEQTSELDKALAGVGGMADKLADSFVKVQSGGLIKPTSTVGTAVAAQLITTYKTNVVTVPVLDNSNPGSWPTKVEKVDGGYKVCWENGACVTVETK